MIKEYETKINDRILVLSDGNELKFKLAIKSKGETLYEYEYVKSITKLGKTVCFTEKN